MKTVSNFEGRKGGEVRAAAGTGGGITCSWEENSEANGGGAPTDHSFSDKHTVQTV